MKIEIVLDKKMKINIVDLVIEEEEEIKIKINGIGIFEWIL
jgi:hypothetical protein